MAAVTLGPAHRSALLLAILLGILLSGCSPNPNLGSVAVPSYDPFVRLGDGLETTAQNGASTPGAGRSATPTLAALAVTVAGPASGGVLVTQTPNPVRSLPTVRHTESEYTVQSGDTLGAIAGSFGVGLAALLQANQISGQDTLIPGSTLKIPAPEMSAAGPAFKVIPDSELVYGPAAADFDVREFVAAQGGYLREYTEEIDTQAVSGADVVALVASNYSVNPRLLLAILEHRSRWVTEGSPPEVGTGFPLGFVHPNRVGLYRQLAWAANELNRGFYSWRANSIGTWVLNDGTVVPIDPTINAGTAGIQRLFGELDDRATWEQDVTALGLFKTYFLLFGSPFDLAIEPLVPRGLSQPGMELPFEPGTSWFFTGGPHASWDSGSAWGALDFAPPDVLGCTPSSEWITAAADGFVVRSSNGVVVQDLDGDGYEQTGWSILYLHVFDEERLPEGTFVFAGERLGHPSCEGGVSNAAHLHLARKHNGEWIPADRDLPFMLGGWISAGGGREYDGFLRRGSVVLEALEDTSDSNRITR